MFLRKCKYTWFLKKEGYTIITQELKIENLATKMIQSIDDIDN